MIGRERMWKLVSWITGALGAFVAQVLIRAIYRMIRKDKAPSAVFDPASSRFSWPDATAWAVAGGVGLAIAKMLSNRVAAIGWEVATGTLPPGAEEQTVG
jgi:hypothetical protein